MEEDRKGGKLNERQRERLCCGVLFFLALFAFLCVGSREPVMFDDSGSYVKIGLVEGVMPAYPLFMLLNQCLFGMEGYLSAVVVEQAVLAAVCVLFFVRTLGKEFHLRPLELCLFFLLALAPYTTELPGSMATQQILTEGLSYSLFYLFAAVSLRAVWTGRYTWCACSFAAAFALAMLRSQLQILFAVCAAVFLYVVCRRRDRGKRAAILVRLAAGTAGGVCLCLLCILAVSKITAGYMKSVKPYADFSVFAMKVQSPEEYEEYLQELADEGAEVVEGPDKPLEEMSAEELADRAGTMIITNQYVSLVFARGMYEADREDEKLFEDAAVRELYRRLYEAVDAEKQRYVYAERGLWMWQDIVGGIGRIGTTCLKIPARYYAENDPEIIIQGRVSDVRNTQLMLIGTTLLRAHLGRFLYHTAAMLPQAFISTVFFQIRPLYFLCHLATLFLYLSAIALTVWGLADSRADRKCAELMAFALVCNAVMVVAISLVFFGQQRYLVYNFGIFYMAYYLLLRRLWTARVRSLISGRAAAEESS